MFSIEDIMSTNLVTIAPAATLADAQSLMQKHRIHHLLVVDHDDALVGLRQAGYSLRSIALAVCPSSITAN